MARKFTHKRKNAKTRIPKPVYLIVAEGKNVTETQYFNSFNSSQNDYIVKAARSSYVTDPEGLWNRARNLWKQYDMSTKNGDKAFVVLDLDCDPKKLRKVNKLRGKDDIEFIVSNPCFEIWFLLHFVYTTREFKNDKDVIRELRKHIPKYEKTMDVASFINDKTGSAIRNVNKLKKYYEEIGVEHPSVDANPMTDVPVMMEVLKK